MLTKAPYNVYDSGDKASKLLAQHTRQATSSHFIPRVYNKKGEMLIKSLGD